MTETNPIISNIAKITCSILCFKLITKKNKLPCPPFPSLRHAFPYIQRVCILEVAPAAAMVVYFCRVGRTRTCDGLRSPLVPNQECYQLHHYPIKFNFLKVELLQFSCMLGYTPNLIIACKFHFTLNTYKDTSFNL